MAIPTITNNSPSPGYIAWSSFTIQLNGVAYAVSAGSSNQRWVWWKYNAGAPTITGGATLPTTLVDDDLVLFSNKNGIGFRVQSSNYVDGELLVDGSIIANALSTNLINSAHIVTAGLDAGVVKFGTMSGDRIAVNTLQGDRILANSILASKLAVADWDNYVTDPYFDIARWNIDNGGGYVTISDMPLNIGTGTVIRFDAGLSGTTRQASCADLFATNPSEVLRSSVWVRKITNAASPTGTVIARVRYYDQAGVNFSPFYIDASYDTASMVQNTWYDLGLDALSVPQGGTDARMELLISGVNAADDFEFAIPQINKKRNGKLIVDGTITANAIGAGQVIADHIGARVITGEMLASVVTFVEKRLQVGDNISISTTDGIVISSDSGFIQFPADKSSPTIVGDFTALSATIMDSLDIRGDENFISGTLKAAAGVSPPAVAPTLSNYWAHQQVPANDLFRTEIEAFDRGGLLTNEIYGLYNTGYTQVGNVSNYFYEIWKWNTGTGASTLVKRLGDDTITPFTVYRPVWGSGTICRAHSSSGGAYSRFILVSNNQAQAPSTVTYKLYKYSDDWLTKTGEYTLSLPNQWNYDPVICALWDSTISMEVIAVLWKDSVSGKLNMRKYRGDTGALVGTTITSTTAYAQDPAFAMENANALHISMHNQNNNSLLAYSKTTLARTSSFDYVMPPATLTGYSYGVGWGLTGQLSTRIMLRDKNGELWYFSDEENPVTLWCKYGYYDNDPAGVYGVGGETTPSPAKSFTHAAGAWMKIDTPKPPDTGDADDPDSISYYLSTTNSNYQFQGIGASGANSTYVSDVATGRPPPTVNVYATRPGNSGRFRSVTSNLLNGVDTGIWDLNGDGSGRVGPLVWDANGNSLSSTGAAKLRANVVQSGVVTATFTKVVFQLIDYDSYSTATASATNNQMVVPKTGRYFINGKVMFASGAGTRRLGMLRRNGTEIVRDEKGNVVGADVATYPSGTFDLNAGDVIELYAWHNAGADVSLFGSYPQGSVLELIEVAGGIGPVGPAGPQGPGLVSKGAWSSTTAYVVNDTVTYNGSSYRRIVSGTTAGLPSTDTTNWELMAAAGGTTFGPGRHVKLRRVADQSIPNTAVTAVIWDTAVTNADGMWSAGTPTRVTPGAGVQVITGRITMNTTTAALINIELWVNGAFVEILGRERADTTGSPWVGNFSTQYTFGANDYMEVRFYQATGVAQNIGYSALTTYSTELSVSGVSKGEKGDPGAPLVDGGWINIPTIATNFTLRQQPQYRVIGNVCYLRGAVSWTASGGYTTGVSTLPAGARPTQNMAWGAGSNTATGMSVMVTTAGLIQFYASAVTAAYFYINTSYPID